MKNIEFPFFHVLTFNFLMLELKKENWRKYISSNNPVAAALLSKMGYTDEERVQVRKEFLRIMTKVDINPAKTRLIFGFFESYLKLDEQEEERLMEEIKRVDEKDEILKLPISWEEKGIEKGRMDERKKIALDMLREGLPIDVIARITELDTKEIGALKKQ
ncbi:hypothetical protein [Virgibacillus phasianinus]|uniref:hypothetical protein n=1 Tax=Virgibacillus phasianinus TaxID=2017483 RepID=UPI003183EF70